MTFGITSTFSGSTPIPTTDSLVPGRDRHDLAGLAGGVAVEPGARPLAHLHRHGAPFGPHERGAQALGELPRHQLLLLVMNEQDVVGILGLERLAQAHQVLRPARADAQPVAPGQLRVRARRRAADTPVSRPMAGRSVSIAVSWPRCSSAQSISMAANSAPPSAVVVMTLTIFNLRPPWRVLGRGYGRAPRSSSSTRRAPVRAPRASGAPSARTVDERVREAPRASSPQGSARRRRHRGRQRRVGWPPRADRTRAPRRT